jgi:hypothetical protein
MSRHSVPKSSEAKGLGDFDPRVAAPPTSRTTRYRTSPPRTWRTSSSSAASSRSGTRPREQLSARPSTESRCGRCQRRISRTQASPRTPKKTGSRSPSKKQKARDPGEISIPGPSDHRTKGSIPMITETTGMIVPITENSVRSGNVATTTGRGR